MLYQLAIYALSREAAGNATILYPALGGLARRATILLHRPTNGAPCGHIRVQPVRLDYLAALLSGPQGSSAALERERRTFAAELAFS